MSVLRVLAISHTIGLVLITIGAVVIADEFLLDDLAWGALAGIAGFIGLALLYRGLARGPMGVIAPLTAITSAAVPAGWGLLIDNESLAGTAWIGVVVALVAIGLASASPIEQSSVSLVAILEALLAGVGFGLMFVGLDQTIEASAPWPIVGGRLMTVSAMAVFFFIVKRVTASARTGRYPASCRCWIRRYVLERAVSLCHPRRRSSDRRRALVSLPDRDSVARSNRARRATHPPPAERVRGRDGRYNVDRSLSGRL